MKSLKWTNLVRILAPLLTKCKIFGELFKIFKLRFPYLQKRANSYDQFMRSSFLNEIIYTEHSNADTWEVCIKCFVFNFNLYINL